MIVANVRELRAISHIDRKSDQVDAEKLGRYARLDPNILRPISHRTVEQQEALTLIVLQHIAEMTAKIKHYDRLIQELTQTEYSETQALLKVHRVGHITALTFVLTLGNKERFGRSRDVGCYLGLRPRRSQSGERDPQLGITKAGNVYLRSLLIECANHILRPHGRDSTLRQWGLHLASRGGKQAKSKAVVAVARKLAVLLHRLWTTQEPYMPFYESAA
ncbi:MAG: transposase family protein [Edaphobacter sp.]|nr:transposase family protein [Edaphobacter sp.]